MFPLSVMAQRVRPFETTVFAEFSALAQTHRAVNLGQGFPNFDGPEAIRQKAVSAILAGNNQYSQSQGIAELRQAVVEHSLRFYGMALDAQSNVAITCGATEALFASFMGLCDVGDEVILFEPSYDSYTAGVVWAGATPRFVRLRAPDVQHATWWFDEKELEQAFSEKTKLLVLNTPHNPTGKVFTRTELEVIAAMCLRHDVLVVADEVYEHLVFRPAKHVRMATLPQMADRTLTLSSGGKTFSFTGWKVGWALGPAPLIQALQRVHQFVTFATPAPFQFAIADALRLPDAYFESLHDTYAAKKELLAAALRDTGFVVFPTEGSYFLMADFSALSPLRDVEFCRWLTTDIGVAAIPPSVFLSESSRPQGEKWVRFAFCKTTEVLEEGIARLKRIKARA